MTQPKAPGKTGANGPEVERFRGAVDEEEVRTTAYFLWEQDGRPDGRAEYYWWLALERVARRRANDALLGATGPRD
jgi:hypothetical protein